MAVRQASVASGEHETDATTKPRRVHFILSGGIYYLGDTGPGSAFLADNGSGVFVLDDDEDEMDRVPYLISTGVTRI